MRLIARTIRVSLPFMALTVPGFIFMALTVLMASIFTASASAAPALSDCRVLGRTCTDTAPRVIAGFTANPGCWEWTDTYDCARPQPLKTDCTALKAHPACTQISQSCIQTKEGVCLRYEVRWHCTEKPENTGQAKLVSETYRIVSDRILGCDAQGTRQDCQLLDQSCTAGPETRSIKGLDVPRDCWEWQRRYDCVANSLTDDCGPLEDEASCTLEQSDCLSHAPDGSCTSEERVWQCGRDVDGAVSQACTAAAWCVDGDCTGVPAGTANTGFGRAATAMSLLQEMANDFKRTGADNITVFSGQKRSCSKWLGGLKNCCSDSGFLVNNDLAECGEAEQKLAAQRTARTTWHVRSYCSKKAFFGVCLVKTEDHCTFNSRLGRMVQAQARDQIGIGTSDCRGLTIDELEGLDWSRIDLSELLGDIEARLRPRDEARIKADMQHRIKAFYKRLKTPASIKGVQP